MPKDMAEAMRLWAAAAIADDLDAKVEYAIALFNGDGIAKDETAAAEMFLKAARRGSPIAQDRLARILTRARHAGRSDRSDQMAPRSPRPPATPTRSRRFRGKLSRDMPRRRREGGAAAAVELPSLTARQEVGLSHRVTRAVGAVCVFSGLRSPGRRAAARQATRIKSSTAMLHSAVLNVMIAAARKAGRALKRDLGEVENLQVSLKGPRNFVTAADRRAEETLREELAKARPDYGFLGEEGGAREGADKSHRWIVDPLDGTTNFLHGIPHFAVSIGLERDGAIVAGLVYNPANDEMFVAERGKGAFLNDKRIRVAARQKLADAVVACGLPHYGRGDLALARHEIAAAQQTFRRPAPLRRRRARSRLGRRRPARRLLGARSVAVGHGGGLAPGARGRRLCQRLRRQGRYFQAKGDVVAGNDSMHRELLRLLKEAAGEAGKAEIREAVDAVKLRRRERGVFAAALRAARRGCRDRAVAQNLAGGLSAVRFRRAAFLVARALARRDHGRGQDRDRARRNDDGAAMIGFVTVDPDDALSRSARGGAGVLAKRHRHRAGRAKPSGCRPTASRSTSIPTMRARSAFTREAALSSPAAA